MPIAYSYVRFSTREQADSDSLRRQRRDAEAYAAKHGLTLDVSYLDAGISAHKGRHIAKGALGRFVTAVADRGIPRGATLLIEAFDRLTRQDALAAMRLFDTLLNADITIVTLEDGQIYTRDSVTKGTTQLIVAVIKMQAAYEYSQRLGRRLRSAWEGKRETLPRRKLTRWCPAWLRYDDDTGQFIVIDTRAAVVRRIFELYIKGSGKDLIARTLNREGIPTWESTGKRPQATGWHIGYVARILSSRATLGEFQPATARQEDGKRRNTKVGPVDPHYFPPVIPLALWDQAVAARAKRQTTGGPKSQGVHNLFSGLLICSECQGPVVLRSKGSRRGKAFADWAKYPSWRRDRYFVCSNASREVRDWDGETLVCADTSLMPVAPFEDAMLNACTGMLFDREVPDDTVLREMETRADRLTGDVAARRANLDAIIGQFADRPEVLASIVRIEAQIAADSRALDDLRRQMAQRRGTLPMSARLNTVKRWRIEAVSPDLGVRVAARLQIAEALKSIINSIVVLAEDQQALVTYGGFLHLGIFGSEFRQIPFDPAVMLEEIKHLDPSDPRFAHYRNIMRRAEIDKVDGDRVIVSWPDATND